MVRQPCNTVSIILYNNYHLNNTVTVIRNGTQVDIKCQDIIQGDLVKVARDCDVPCDLVLLKSSDPHGKCHITTANLDGESNLKTLIVPKNLPNVNAGKYCAINLKLSVQLVTVYIVIVLYR